MKHAYYFSDIPNLEFYLSDNFCKYHFLVGLLLKQVKVSLNEIVPIRKIALSTLRNLLAKHELDDRYQDKVNISNKFLFLKLLSRISLFVFSTYQGSNK